MKSPIFYNFLSQSTATFRNQLLVLRRRRLRVGLHTPREHGVCGLREGGALKVLTTASLEAEGSGDFRKLRPFSLPPLHDPNMKLQSAKTGLELENISLGLLPQLQFPRICPALWRRKGVARKTTSGVPCGRGWRGPERGSRNPSLARSSHAAPRPPAPQQRPPAGRKRSLCGCASLPPPPLPRPAGCRDRGFPRTCQVHGGGVPGPALLCGFLPGSRSLAAGGCA